MTILAAGDARYKTAAATSVVSAKARIGIRSSKAFDISGSSSKALVNSVRTRVGAIAFTRMPRGAHSTARPRVRLISLFVVRPISVRNLDDQKMIA